MSRPWRAPPTAATCCQASCFETACVTVNDQVTGLGVLGRAASGTCALTTNGCSVLPAKLFAACPATGVHVALQAGGYKYWLISFLALVLTL